MLVGSGEPGQTLMPACLLSGFQPGAVLHIETHPSDSAKVRSARFADNTRQLSVVALRF